MFPKNVKLLLWSNYKLLTVTIYQLEFLFIAYKIRWQQFFLVFSSSTGSRCRPGAMWPPLLPERAQNHQRPSTDCHMQFEYHTANPQEGSITIFVLFILLHHIISSKCKWCSQTESLWSWISPDSTACRLCLFLIVEKPVPVIRPHNVHTEAHMHTVLWPVAWLNVGSPKIMQKNTCMFVVALVYHNKLYLFLYFFAFALIVLLFVSFVNPIDFFWCLLLFLLLHFHPLTFISASRPPPAHYNFPAIHCVISPLLSRNASWNYHRTWSLTLMMR